MAEPAKSEPKYLLSWLTCLMFKNATDKYTALGEYLQSAGLKCDVFPQGSFSLGTVVRPYKNSEEVDYDLDVVCCIDRAKYDVQPKTIKNKVKDLLCQSVYYLNVKKTTLSKRVVQLFYATSRKIISGMFSTVSSANP